jgi:hypothetical protein
MIIYSIPRNGIQRAKLFIHTRELLSGELAAVIE